MLLLNRGKKIAASSHGISLHIVLSLVGPKVCELEELMQDSQDFTAVDKTTPSNDISGDKWVFNTASDVKITLTSGVSNVQGLW